MNEGAWITVLVSTVTGIFSFLVARGTNKTTLERTNYENANELFKQYQSANADLREEMATMKESFNKDMQKVRDEMNSLKKQFEQKETFYKNEIEKLEDKVDELEIENVQLKAENLKLKGEI